MDIDTVKERIRRHIRSTERYKQTRAINRPEKQEIVGIIGDTHFPFAHPNYLPFLQNTFEKYGVTKIVQIGDLADHHAISRHQTDTEAVSATTEFEVAYRDVERYISAFPKVDVTLGNHCLIPVRQCATLGIPQGFLKSFKDLWQLPDGWTVQEQTIINNVLYSHGIGSSGKNGALNKATDSMQSCVIGHQHSFGGVQYKSNSRSLIFGLNVGCGIDIDAYAFAYGKYNRNRETLGCGIVFDSANAIFVPMEEKYFRKG